MNGKRRQKVLDTKIRLQPEDNFKAVIMTAFFYAIITFHIILTRITIYNVV